MKQAIINQVYDDIRALSAKKKKGINVGRLKFVSNVNSIGLSQYNRTHKIIGNYIKLQGLKEKIKVYGLNQISKEADIANGKLIKKGKDFYFKITTFMQKEKRKPLDNSIGIDFGIKDNLTLSNGQTYNVKIRISQKTKSLQKQFKNKAKYSKNWNKLKIKVQESYQKTTNKRLDARHKIVSKIINNYDIICVQDENIKGWQSSLFGRQVQQSCLGGIMSDLKRSRTLNMVDRFYPTTKECPMCGKLNDMPLSKRTYSCTCGYSSNRDVHSARNVLRIGLLPTERRIKPVEIRLNTLVTFKQSHDLGSRKPLTL